MNTNIKKKDDKNEDLQKKEDVKNEDLQKNELEQYLLDPLSVIIKLAIISKKDSGVKVSISNNILYIQEIGIFQPIVRYYFNSSKNDLNYLYNPIDIACRFFLNKKKYDNIPMDHLFTCALRGLEIIKDTYKNYPLIIICLNYYCNIIKNYMEKKNEDLFKKDVISEFYTDELIKKLNIYWSIDKIKLIIEMTEHVYNDNSKINSIKCLEVFMNDVDINTQMIISQN